MITSPTGSTLYVEVHGPQDAPPVILTHGWGLDSTIWYYLRRHLSQRFRVIVWDLPGLGRSRAASGQAIDLSHFAQDLKALLSLTGGKPAVLVGHSIGGMTIQTLVRDHPDVLDGSVAGLVLVNTTYTNPLRTMVLNGLAQALRWPLLEPLFRLDDLAAAPGLAERLAELSERLGASGQPHRLRQPGHPQPARTDHAIGHPQSAGRLGPRQSGDVPLGRGRALQAITVPTLILAGDSDLVTKCEASKTLSRATPGGRLEVIAEANHMGFLERSEIYNEEIGRFCELNLITRAGLGVREPTMTQA